MHEPSRGPWGFVTLHARIPPDSAGLTKDTKCAQTADCPWLQRFRWFRRSGLIPAGVLLQKPCKCIGFSHSEGSLPAGQRHLCQSRLPLPSRSPRQRRLISYKERWGGATARSRQRRGPAPEERRGLLHRQHRRRALVEAVVAISRACSCAGGASHPGRSGPRRHATLGRDPSGQRDGSRRQLGPTETPRLGWRRGLL